MDKHDHCQCTQKWGDHSGRCGFCKRPITGAIDWRAMYRQWCILRILQDFTGPLLPKKGEGGGK